MPWGQFLLSQRHWLYLRVTCTRGQQQKEWWDFLQYSDFSIFLVLVSHYAVIRVLFTVLESICIATFSQVLHLEGEQNSLKHQKYIYRTIRLTQCCTQFKSAGDKILCVFYLPYNVAFTFKWYVNSWNKTFYSQRVWIGYKIELAE